MAASSAFWQPISRRKELVPQLYTHPKTRHLFLLWYRPTQIPASEPRLGLFTEHYSARDVHFFHWYNVLNYALRSFRQSDREACSYQSAQGKREAETGDGLFRFNLPTLLCIRVTNCRSSELSTVEFFPLNPFSSTLSVPIQGTLKKILRRQPPSFVL